VAAPRRGLVAQSALAADADLMYELPFEDSQHVGIATAELPARARVIGENEQELPLPSPEESFSCFWCACAAFGRA